jgi:hypothetical protein
MATASTDTTASTVVAHDQDLRCVPLLLPLFAALPALPGVAAAAAPATYIIYLVA